MKELREVLGRELLIEDGAMGTWLLSQGASASQLPMVPLSQPDLLLRAHLDYLKAGARLLETHTFAANAGKLGALGISADVAELNRRAAQIARHARDIHGASAYIVGSMGPLNARVESRIMPGISMAEAQRQYGEMVAGLLAGGVDGFIVETMSDMLAIQAAVAAIRRESDLPIIVSLTFSRLGTTLYGFTPEEVVEELAHLPGGPPQMVGANCGTGPALLLDAAWRMADVAKKYGMALAVSPNAGEPYVIDGHVAYPASAEYMAALAPAFKAAGCLVIGGCCGTTPAHIQAMAERVKDEAPSVADWRPLPVVREEAPIAEPSRTHETLLDLLDTRFVVSVELDPPRSPNLERFLESARAVAKAGAPVINIADSPMARVRLSALAAARLLQESVGVQSLLHFTTRDRNLMGIQSDLLGAYALGVRNVLALTGDPPGIGDYAHATAVYDIDSVGLVRVLHSFNQGQDALGQPLGTATAFAVGVGLNPTAEDLDREIQRLQQKIEAGAQYCLTQPIYSADQLYRFLDRWSGSLPPLLLGIMPLVSYRQAMYLHHEVPGITIPDAVLAAMESSLDAMQTGTELAIDLLNQVSSLVRGVYLVPSFNRVTPLIPILEALKRLTGATSTS
ncbi:MAG: bifunctional homocysteine S-methyltransferase/methylenetetrahydrofolate reductase [Sulfobacillus acidophilus]|uniref:Bifunctional homocysteine S-methyltransferase/methylenetetrahydrofolate reductase n=1 Tax=Sulfobacillus acidophilus TaxID=53633 RepID=A0A2T2WD64_9FIRM|nr:MAG: bifunctional homocysteine S-methyltransferase/methylenetetrahydrofolate reductase [Sulfobacillus acidophilus]